jgi:DNA-binding helix-hairpin-helix protein with protein kinase domain
MSAMGKTAGEMRRCAFCGKHMASHLMQCPFCREAVPQVQLSPLRNKSGSDGQSQIRRGLLYMLLGGVVHYFAGGYGAPIFQIPLPAPVMPLVTQYLTPLLFLGGLGFTIYGLFLKVKS